MNESSPKESMRVLVGVTGASGSVYAERLVAVLLEAISRVYLVATEAGQQVVDHELRGRNQGGGFSLAAALKQGPREEDKKTLRVFRNQDLFAPVASGSSVPSAMVVVPCSMGTAARIASGISGNLLERAADVCLKQRRPVILVPRETPFNTVHLENLLKLSKMGVTVAPAMPAFYQKPKSLDDLADFMAGRVLELLELPHDLYASWNPRMM